MKTAFFAKVASFSDDGYGSLLAFADASPEPVNYVMLGLANEPEEQDLRLGLDGVHIDAGALRIEGYDLVEDIRETDTGIVISLTPDAARNDAGKMTIGGLPKYGHSAAGLGRK